MDRWQGGVCCTDEIIGVADIIQMLFDQLEEKCLEITFTLGDNHIQCSSASTSA